MFTNDLIFPPGAAVQSRRTAFTTAFQSGDYNTASEFFTDDCKYMTWGTKLINGRDAAKAYFQKTYTSPSGTMIVTADEVLEAGELAIERGSWVLSGATADQGK